MNWTTWVVFVLVLYIIAELAKAIHGWYLDKKTPVKPRKMNVWLQQPDKKDYPDQKL